MPNRQSFFPFKPSNWSDPTPAHNTFPDVMTAMSWDSLTRHGCTIVGCGALVLQLCEHVGLLTVLRGHACAQQQWVVAVHGGQSWGCTTFSCGVVLGLEQEFRRPRGNHFSLVFVLWWISQFALFCKLSMDAAAHDSALAIRRDQGARNANEAI